MGKPVVKFCKKCSGIKSKDLKGILPKDAWKEGCVHACVKKSDKAERVFARIDGRLVVASSKKDLIAKIKDAVA
ncbi:hypothetical protein [Collinsella tanakaei]|uniref:hypothetical protein n=1 Tax=Collinsella tanakaei TaxID=626935 RepID=UPI001F362C14|nr:hypothetical protein [Collinsella tanakaei]MCF2621979.1 DUF1450 domain-containing protein [Collinsella tanakaei]MDM8302050.1 hypothetical protein [Collinsella tanakaei]